MPIYEYVCEKCNEITEEFYSIVCFPKQIACPVCGNIATKIISKNTFRLEGGGWCKDGYVSNMAKFKENMKAVDNY